MPNMSANQTEQDVTIGPRTLDEEIAYLEKERLQMLQYAADLTERASKNARTEEALYLIKAGVTIESLRAELAPLLVRARASDWLVDALMEINALKWHLGLLLELHGLPGEKP